MGPRVKIQRVVCGMSGGVDSAVAASLLKQKGYEVIGAFMKNWDDQDEDGTCRIKQEEDFQDARHTCDHLRIPFVEVSFVKEYWNEVFTRLLEDYERGFTPNPDILCNKFVKFGSFYGYARRVLGADAIATGHYARNSFGKYLEGFGSSGEARLLRAFDVAKDQTLFLSEISQEALQRTMFPLGEFHKHNVRQLASEFGLEKLSRKRDSTGICFIGDRRFPRFISKYLENRPGVFVDVDSGKVVGEHNGVHQWTLGQRCRVSGGPHAYYVCRRDPKSQIILAALGHGHPSLYSRHLVVSPPHWISDKPDLSGGKPFHCMFRFQHTEWVIPCRVVKEEDKDDNSGEVEVQLAVPTRAITPGQQAVFYRGNVCLGSSKILSSDSLVSLDSVLDRVIKSGVGLVFRGNEEKVEVETG